MYTCPRCGYNSHIKTYLRKHFLRKKSCKITRADISIEECFLGVLEEKFEKRNIEPKLNPNEPKLNPIDSKMTPIDSKMTPIDSKMTPIDSKMTPIDSKMTPIDSHLNYLCKFCKKGYSKNSNLHRHMKNCKKQIIVSNNKNEDNLLKYITLIEQEKSVIEKENKLIKKENQVLQKEIEKLIDKVGGNTTINNNQQNNIYINNYGNENVEYLIKACLDNLLKIPHSSVLNLIKDTCFNPENHNIKIPSRKEKYAIEYMEGEGEKDFISNIVDKNYNMVDCHFEDNMMTLTDIKKHNFIEFWTDYSENENIKKDIEEEHILNS